jgi:hypothetical protein
VITKEESTQSGGVHRVLVQNGSLMLYRWRERVVEYVVNNKLPRVRFIVALRCGVLMVRMVADNGSVPGPPDHATVRAQGQPQAARENRFVFRCCFSLGPDAAVTASRELLPVPC